MNMFVDAPAIWLYPGHVDFRKSINVLALIIEQEAVHSPFDDALFAFWRWKMAVFSSPTAISPM